MVDRLLLPQIKGSDDGEVVGTQPGTCPHGRVAHFLSDKHMIQRQPKRRKQRRPGRIETPGRPPQVGFSQQVSVTGGERGHVEIAGPDHWTIKSLNHRRQRLGLFASKHGVSGLTRSVALEIADKNIRVNAVCPGFTRTPMAAAEIAAAVVWVCSDAASLVTGQTLSVDGGVIAGLTPSH